jgi:hypothetical protein
VAGEELVLDCFAYQNPDGPKLPIKFSDEAKSKRHITNNIARWANTKMPDADERAKAWKRMAAAVKESGIEIDKEKAKRWAITDVEYRDLRASDPNDPDGDGDDDSATLDAMNTAAKACQECREALSEAGNSYDDDSLSSASTEIRKAITVLKKAVEAIDQELKVDEEGDNESERILMRVRAVAASL